VVEEADSDGGDLYNLELTKNLTGRIEILQQVCAELPQCNGFNTNGWLKTRVAPAGQRRNQKGTALWIKRPVLKFPLPLPALPAFPPRSDVPRPASGAANGAGPAGGGEDATRRRESADATEGRRAGLHDSRSSEPRPVGLPPALPLGREASSSSSSAAAGGGRGSAGEARSNAIETLGQAESEIARMRATMLEVQQTLQRLLP
jgi:hypothetical protein